MTTFIFGLADEITATIDADDEAQARRILQERIDGLVWFDMPSEFHWALVSAY